MEDIKVAVNVQVVWLGVEIIRRTVSVLIAVNWAANTKPVANVLSVNTWEENISRVVNARNVVSTVKCTN